MGKCIQILYGKTVQALHMRWAPNADAALKDALSIVGENAAVTVIPDGVGMIFIACINRVEGGH